MNKASGGDGIPVELFQILKDDAVKVLHSLCQQIWKTQHGNEKDQFSFQSLKRQCQRMLKLPHNCTHLIRQQSNAQNSSSETSTVREPRTSRCSSWIQKGRGTTDQIANIRWIIEKAREFQKNIYFCFIDYAKAFVWIKINCGKFFKRWEYQTI